MQPQKDNPMKTCRIIGWICAVCMLCAPMTMSAQADKAVLETGIKLEKEGWRSFPGMPRMAEQLETYYNMRMEFDDELFPKYVFAHGISDTCFTLTEAEQHAMAMGRIELIMELNLEVQTTTLFDEKTNCQTMESSYTYGDYMYKSVVRQSLNSEEAFSYTVFSIKYKDELLYESLQIGDITDNETTYWDAMVRNSDKHPFLKAAWPVVKLYRKTEKGYQVHMTMCNYAK